MTRKRFYDILQDYPDCDINKKMDQAESFLLNSQNYSEDQQKQVKHKLSNLKSEIKRRWVASHYVEDLFLKRNDSWLQGTFELPQAISRPGRPQKSFDDVSERSKRRKTETLRREMTSEELTFATHVKLRCEGKADASNVIKNLTKSPTRAKKYRKALIESQKEQNQQLTPVEALSMFVEAGLSRKQYEIIRSFKNKKSYPCYTILQKAKKDCYPVQESYRITATCAEVNLQDVLNHTASRLLLSLTEVVQHLDDEERNSLILMYKWGCDGSQQTMFKQTFENNSDSDANIFQSSFVPLQLSCGQEKKLIWQNPLPSSPRYCRPIRIRFVKETADITKDEISYIENKINLLEPTQITQQISKTFTVKHVMMFTMVDAKVCNAATNTKSTMKCYICGATSKDFNNLSMRKQINEDTLKFGLSTLHARIRLFEAILHLAYKLPVKRSK